MITFLLCFVQAPADSADFTIGGQKFPYPYSDEPAADCKEENKRATKINAEKKQKGTSDLSVPEYKIVHRGNIDLQNFTYARLYFLIRHIFIPQARISKGNHGFIV